MQAAELSREANSRYGLDSSASSSSGSARQSLADDRASLDAVLDSNPAVPNSEESGTGTATNLTSEDASPVAGHMRRSTGLSVILPEAEEEAQGLIQGTAVHALNSAGPGKRSRRNTPAAGSRTPSRFRAVLRSARQRHNACFGIMKFEDLLQRTHCIEMQPCQQSVSNLWRRSEDCPLAHLQLTRGPFPLCPEKASNADPWGLIRLQNSPTEQLQGLRTLLKALKCITTAAGRPIFADQIQWPMCLYLVSSGGLVT